MRIAARFAVAVTTAFALFVIGFIAVFVINLAIYGAQEFDGDAGAKFGMFGEAVAAGFVLSIVGFVVGARLARRIPLESGNPRTEGN